jgi:exonuclease VII small subunit
MSDLLQNVVNGTTDPCTAQNEFNQKFDKFKEEALKQIIQNFIDMIHSLDRSIDEYLRGYKTLREATKDSQLDEKTTNL